MSTIHESPIRPSPISPSGLGGTMPTSPTPHGLKRAMFDTIMDSVNVLHGIMDLYGSDSPNVDQEFAELDGLIKALGHSETKIFFYRHDTYRVCFDNSKFNHLLDPFGHNSVNKTIAEKQLKPKEVASLKLKQVQTALTRFRDAALTAKGNDDVEQVESLARDLEKNLDQILKLELRHQDAVTGRLVAMNT